MNTCARPAAVAVSFWWTLCGRRLLVLGLVLAGTVAAQANVADLWTERLATVVAVEFTTETELERVVNLALGVVADDQGTVILPATAVNHRATPEQLLDFRVYRPGEPTASFATATYLGQDIFTGFHFVRVSAEGRAGLRPITDFVGERTTRAPRIAEAVWGIGLRKKDEDFRPYFMRSQVSVLQALPQQTAIALEDVTGPGLPVFDEHGSFLGLGHPGFGQSLVLFSRRQRGPEQVVLIDADECAAFRLADEVLPYLNRIPGNPYGRPLPWLGVNGFQTVDPDVATFLKLESQAGLVVGEVLAGSPAQQGGLQERDILLTLDGEPLPRLKPDVVLPAYLEREVARRGPGQPMRFGVLRGTEQITAEVVLGDAPPTPREAPRRYLERLGFTARELVYADAVERRVDPAESVGLVVHFVKPSSPSDTAGLRLDDWIQQIDGVQVTSFAAAAEQLAAIADDQGRTEFVLLVRRGSETAVLRVRLN